jgi:hypothetical protein
MLPVVHIISVIDVVDIDFIGPVPNRRPGFRAWIYHTEPETAELETWGAFDHYHWDVVDAKPVSTAKMRPEAIFRNAVSVVAAAFVPGSMLTLPVVGTLALPNVLPRVAWSRLGPSHLAQFFMRMPTVLAPLDDFVVAVFVALYRPACIISAVLSWSLRSVFLLVNVAFLSVITFVISPAVLRVGKHGRSQQQSEY